MAAPKTYKESQKAGFDRALAFNDSNKAPLMRILSTICCTFRSFFEYISLFASKKAVISSAFSFEQKLPILRTITASIREGLELPSIS